MIHPQYIMTADEQLFPSKTRCSFLQYMPNKHHKFGIKFWLLVDVDSKYLCNGFPYLGKNEQRPDDDTLLENVVMRLAAPYLNKGRNMTTDNFFTTVKVGNKLKEKDTSLVGTMKHDRKEIPNTIKTMKNPLYTEKQNKNALLYSTMHSDVEVKTSTKRLPETIRFHNWIKFAVDVIDQMARKYSVRSRTRGWSVHVFHNILDLTAINSWIVFKGVTGQKISRRNFILQLAEELHAEYVESRKQSYSTEDEDRVEE
ncbi:hypothetical protein ANN_24486, partial [Periplaneta americana]